MQMIFSLLSRSGCVVSFLVRARLLLASQLLGQLVQILGRLNINNAVHLARVAHELLGAGVEHADFGVARDGEVVEHDVRHLDAAVGLCSMRISNQPTPSNSRRRLTKFRG